MSAATYIDGFEIHAYIDGQLDDARRRAFEDALGVDPSLAAQVAAYRSDKEMLKRVYGSLDRRPLPQKWIVRANRFSFGPAVSWRMVGSIAAALVVGIIGIVSVQRLQVSRSNEIVQAAFEARTTDAEAEQTIAVRNAADVQNYDRTLSNALEMPVKVPDMRRMGYRLTGIRFYGSSSVKGAAELSYEGPQNQLFTLYVRRSDGTIRFDQFERRGLKVCVWQDEALGTVMIGNVSVAAMQRLASLAYTGLAS